MSTLIILEALENINNLKSIQAWTVAIIESKELITKALSTTYSIIEYYKSSYSYIYSSK